MTKPKIRIEELDQAFSVPSVYCDRVYITVDSDIVRFTFAESMPEVEKPKCRVAVSMRLDNALNIQGALATLVDAINKAHKIEESKPKETIN